MNSYQGNLDSPLRRRFSRGQRVRVAERPPPSTPTVGAISRPAPMGAGALTLSKTVFTVTSDIHFWNQRGEETIENLLISPTQKGVGSQPLKELQFQYRHLMRRRLEILKVETT
ncbi:hypothetical protein Y032_0150g2755 [Ancylostoma ceylanicum]|uniref:Uncharacterized protein n=1 Tax=Ancylostoma ceylanicum TaxID=53326 RepID=A0A016T1H4_9BILA|nr:hypothetical protein Y032_0150g2755 [Ancylostoma ceylanicum]